MRDEQGRFLPGPDRARHALTRAERRRGYRNAMRRTLAKDVNVHAWLFRKVRGYYRAAAREAAG